MSKKIGEILKLIISIILLLFFDIACYKLFNLVGVNINSFSNFVKSIIDLVIKLVISIILFILYKKDLKKRRVNNNILKNILLSVISVFVIAIFIALYDYILTYLCNTFKVDKYIMEQLNIFNKTISIDLILVIIKNYILIPFIYIITIVLGLSKIIRNDNSYILLTGILASILYSLSLNGTILFLVLNSSSIFLLFCLLAFLYKKFNNIWYIVFIYILYLLSNNIIISYLGL